MNFKKGFFIFVSFIFLIGCTANYPVGEAYQPKTEVTTINTFEENWVSVLLMYHPERGWLTQGTDGLWRVWAHPLKNYLFIEKSVEGELPLFLLRYDPRIDFSKSVISKEKAFNPTGAQATTTLVKSKPRLDLEVKIEPVHWNTLRPAVGVFDTCEPYWMQTLIFNNLDTITEPFFAYQEMYSSVPGQYSGVLVDPSLLSGGFPGGGAKFPFAFGQILNFYEDDKIVTKAYVDKTPNNMPITAHGITINSNMIKEVDESNNDFYLDVLAEGCRCGTRAWIEGEIAVPQIPYFGNVALKYDKFDSKTGKGYFSDNLGSVWITDLFGSFHPHGVPYTMIWDNNPMAGRVLFSAFEKYIDFKTGNEYLLLNPDLDDNKKYSHGATCYKKDAHRYEFYN